MDKNLNQEDYYENLPRKRMAAGVLFFDKNRKLLIVKPTYKNSWEIPGGVVELNESPKQTCVREVKEEIGLSKNKLTFLCVDYTGKTDNKTESLQFIFYGGILNNKEIKNIKLSLEELSEFKFTTIKEVKKLLNLDGKRLIAKRVGRCVLAIKKNKGVYLENAEVMN